ncbi:lysophospholipase [Daedaleopsis nitida]|nr:lysophospholipase [Daedaleopsis nitida]
MLALLLTLSLQLLALCNEVASQNAAAAAYAPTLHPCPRNFSLVRKLSPNARQQTLSPRETRYVSARQSRVLPRAWASYFHSVQSSTDAALPAYVAKILLGHSGRGHEHGEGQGHGALPTLGIATSGGGYRAAIFGAGVLNALDGRKSTSARAGTGGLLQAATYLSGLSGGSWLVGSLVQADFPTLPDLIFGRAQDHTLPDGNALGGWVPEISLLQPGDANETATFVGQLIRDVARKHAMGFPVTITDVWGRALARHFVSGTTVQNFFDDDLKHGAGITWSSLADISTIVDHTQPFPVIVANTVSSRIRPDDVTEPGDAVPLTSPIYEFNIYETGSFDPALAAFIPTQFLGSTNDSVCVTGYDQVSFIEGISSDLFNEFNTSEAALAASSVGPIIAGLRQALPQSGIRLDSAVVPNPFFGMSRDTFLDSDQHEIVLVDGGEDGEVTPVQPLLVKARGVDTIIAIDASADTTENWTNGSSIIATQHRVDLFRTSYSFPPVPSSASVFVTQDLTRRPTFFGCNSPSSADDPLVIYIANGGPPLGEPPLTNTSTNQVQYPLEQVHAMLSQIFDVSTQGIPVFEHGRAEKDPEWPACLACAVVDRKRREMGTPRSGVCRSCLERYCWS